MNAEDRIAQIAEEARARDVDEFHDCDYLPHPGVFTVAEQAEKLTRAIAEIADSYGIECCADGSVNTGSEFASVELWIGDKPKLRMELSAFLEAFSSYSSEPKPQNSQVRLSVELNGVTVYTYRPAVFTEVA